MPDIKDEPGTTVEVLPPEDGTGPAPAQPDLQGLVEAAAASGRLDKLIAIACQKALDSGATEGPGDEGAWAAAFTFRAWGQYNKPTPKPGGGIYVRPAGVKLRPGKPEALPLELAGQWVAWSADGLRIVASAPDLNEAYRFAAEAGEPEPMMQPHPGRYRR